MPATTWAGVEPGITSCVVRAVDQDGLESADSARVFPQWETEPGDDPPGAPTNVRVVAELPPSTGPPVGGVMLVGSTVVDGVSNTMPSGGNFILSHYTYTAAASGDAVKAFAYVGGDVSFKVGLFSAAGALIAESSVGVAPATAGWVEVAFPTTPITESTEYKLGIFPAWYIEIGRNSQTWRCHTAAYTYPTIPTSVTTEDNNALGLPAIYLEAAAAGGTTVEASLSTPAAALAGFDSRVIARGGVTAAASAGETHGASSTIRAAITAGATAQEVAGGVASMAAQLAAAAHAGAEATARATMAATITESAGAGEAVSRQGAVLDQMVAAAEADALLSAYLQAVAALAAGVEAGDAWAARLTAAATLSGAAEAGAEFSEDSVALIAEQSEAGAQFAAAVHALAEQLEGATAGAAMAGVVSTLAAFSSASSAGAVFESAMRHADALQAGAEAGAAFSGITGELTGLLLESVSAAMVVSSAHQARAAWSATAYAGASFVASGDVSALIGALAFVVAAEQRVFTVPEETRTFIVS